MTPLAELVAIQRKRKRNLDDDSLPLLAHLRENGIIDDEAWSAIKAMMSDALKFLSVKPKKSDVLSPDSDPRGADWIKIVRVRRASGRQMAKWASLWLNRLYHDRGKAFWTRVGKLAEELNVAPLADRRARR